MSLAEAIDRTPWIDTHEHLVDERRRMEPDPYVFTGVRGERMCIPGGWTALLAHYVVDDLVSAGLDPPTAHRLVIPLIHAHPRTTFDLMHAAWPQQEQLLSVAKHFPNAVVDLCWAWSLAPRSTTDVVQRFLTTVPANKLLCFGGDSMVVETVVGHAELARRGLQAALEGLVRDDWLTPDEALALVPQLMRGNALAIFG